MSALLLKSYFDASGVRKNKHKERDLKKKIKNKRKNHNTSRTNNNLVTGLN